MQDKIMTYILTVVEEKMCTDYLAFMVHIFGTIFLKKYIDVSYACYRKISKNYIQNNSIIYRMA